MTACSTRSARRSDSRPQALAPRFGRQSDVMGTKTGEVEIRATPQALRRTATWLRRWAPRQASSLLTGAVLYPTLALSRRLFALSADRRRKRAVLTREEAAAIVRLIAGTTEARVIMGLPCPPMHGDVHQLVDACKAATKAYRGAPGLTRAQLAARIAPGAPGDVREMRRLRVRARRLNAIDDHLAEMRKHGGTLLTGRRDPP